MGSTTHDPWTLVPLGAPAVADTDLATPDLDGDHEVYLFDPAALAALVAEVAAA